VLHIEFARRRKHWTQKQLAHVARTNQFVVSQIERGVWNPNADLQRRLSWALDIPLDSLLQPVVKAVLASEEQSA